MTTATSPIGSDQKTNPPPAPGWTYPFWILLLALVYILPGLVGHDPWKQDEAYSFGIIYNMVTTGDLVVPTLAADPFLEKPPAYYISAAGMVHLLGDELPLHDAARVTTGIYLGLTFIFAGLWGRRTWGPGCGATVVAALIGTLGLMLHGHWMITDVALTAGMVMAGYGLVRAQRSGLWGGLWLGTGGGLAFLSKGLLGAGILGLAALLLLVFATWRNRTYRKALGLALVWALPWLLVWPLELYLRSPDLFRLWLVDNNLGRYFGDAHLGPPADWTFWVRTLPWATFPLLPLGVWTLIRRPREVLGNPGVQVALAVSLVGWGVLLSAGTGRDLYVLPLLAPLAVLAVGGLRELPDWLIASCYWACVLVFGALAALLWGLWGFGLLAGHPPQVELIGKHLPLDFRPTLHGDAALAALALTLAWLLAVKRLRPPRAGALAAWPLGLTRGWALLMLLHLPWLDLAKSYRGVFTELAAQLPADHGCVAAPADEKDPARFTRWNRMYLRESERGLLHYFAGIKTVGATDLTSVGCDWLLVEAGRGTPATALDLGPAWEPVWDGRRPADRRDTFILFRRVQGQAPTPKVDRQPIGPGRRADPWQQARLQPCANRSVG